MGKRKKRGGVFVFTSPLPSEELRHRLREAVHNRDDLLYEDTPDGFDLGIERGGHSGGYWYAATLTETGDGTEMRGEIVYRSYHKDGELREDTKWEKFREWLGIVLMVIFLSPVFLIALMIWGILLLIGKLRKKPFKATMSTQEKLTHFMTKIMGCNTIE